MTEPVVIGFGGNVGTPAEIAERFADARLELVAAFGDVTAALLYRSAPIGPAQPDYFNTAVKLFAKQTSPEELLSMLHGIERSHGRRRADEQRFGPRALDLDILVFGSRIIHAPELDVPHPRLHERRFALEPLVTVVGKDFEVPGLGRAGELLSRVGDQRVEMIGAW